MRFVRIVFSATVEQNVLSGRAPLGLKNIMVFQHFFANFRAVVCSLKINCDTSCLIVLIFL